MVVATLATFGYPAVCAALALHAGLAEVSAAAAGGGRRVGGRPHLRRDHAAAAGAAEPAGKVSSIETFGAFGPGSLGLALAGPAVALFGPARVLGFGAAWSVAATLAVLALPSVPPPGGTRRDPAD